ncbi:virion-associated protein [Proteus phage Privateer]|uniref:Virion-associated protein n=1 Tax=Proteus phage Privateer TaxID=2712958 RepID=A0A6G8R3M2_9CAUD|nr:tail protein [Proteus phage Privateer]QIN94805.1 virion-associated protein [Proteus phage Privateer]
MAVETVAQFITQLEPSYPRKNDLLKEGDDHIRLIKRIIQNTFPKFNSFLSITSDKLNDLDKKLEVDETTLKVTSGLSLTGKRKTVNFNPQGVSTNQNIVTGIPDPRKGSDGLYDAVNVNWLTTSGVILDKAYPVDSIYITVSDLNPKDSLGFGKWEPFGEGRVLMGVGTGNDGTNVRKFDKPLVKGGEYMHKLTEKELPPHNHKTEFSVEMKEAGDHYHGFGGDDQLVWGNELYNDEHFGYDAQSKSNGRSNYYKTTSDGRHKHEMNIKYEMEKTGGGEAHNVIQPYITVFMWRRIS